MITAERAERITSITIARAMIEQIENIELPRALEKAAACRKNNWGIMEAQFCRWATSLQIELVELKTIVDRELVALSRKE